MKIRNSYHRIAEKLNNPTPEKQAKQAFKKESDINVLMERYEKTGLLPQRNGKPAIYGDVSGVTDYLSSIQRVQAAHEAFDSLPAKIRKHFKNDPAALLSALEDESRKHELIELGVLQSSTEEKVKDASQSTKKENSSAKAEEKAP